nr:hypothetical protein [uncultured Bacillus sp.]
MEHFFENPFWIVVLIAVLSSFFKKKKEISQGKQQSRQSPMKEKSDPAGPLENVPDLFQELTRTLHEQLDPRPQKAASQSAAKRLKSKGKAGSPAKIAGTEVIPEPQLVREQIQPVPMQSPEDNPKELEIRDKQLIDAVIWSEVLGPPRAKKPYLRKNSRS